MVIITLVSDPDSLEMKDPDTMNPDPQHWFLLLIKLSAQSFFSKIVDVVSIFRFQIQDITVVSEEDQATRSAKDALLLW